MENEQEKNELKISGKSQGLSDVRRDVKGRFPVGVSGNLKGGPKGPKRAVAQLYKAIERFKREEGMDFWSAALKLGWQLAQKGKTSLLETVISKALPQVQQIEADVTGRSVTVMGQVVLTDGKELAFDVGQEQQEVKK